MSKDNKCSDLTMNDSGSIFFWGLIAVLFLLVIGNFFLIMTIISFFNIGMGMEAIKLVPEMKSIKFYGVVDFENIYKKDGNVDTFKDSPLKIDAGEEGIKFNFLNRLGKEKNHFEMDSNGMTVKEVNHMIIKDPETSQHIFSLSKSKYNIQKDIRRLSTKSVHVPEVVSPIDEKLRLDSQNLFVRGIEGTNINGKGIHLSAKYNAYLKSSNGSIYLNSNGIYLDGLPRVERQAKEDSLQYKLCVCYPKGVLYRVDLSLMHNVKDPCRRFKVNPCD